MEILDALIFVDQQGGPQVRVGSHPVGDLPGGGLGRLLRTQDGVRPGKGPDGMNGLPGLEFVAGRFAPRLGQGDIQSEIGRPGRPERAQHRPSEQR